jgi:hypothetical protein
MAVSINTTPINPEIQRNTPDMKKARIVRTTPEIRRKIVSPLPIFFALLIGSIFPP